MAFPVKFLIAFIGFWMIQTPTIAQKDPDRKDIIAWKANRPLQFADFKGKAPKQEPDTRADTTIVLVDRLAGIAKSISVDLTTTATGTKFIINAEMLRTASWFKNADDSIALRHEQAHFDIAEIHARILRKEIKTATSIDKAKAIYESVLQRESVMQRAFDKENTFLLGGVTPAWRKKIDDQLITFSNFSNPVVVTGITK